MNEQYYKVEKLDGYYRIGSPEQVFSYLIVGKEKAMLIDTGYGYGDLKSVVRGITDKPLIIIATHGHCDHIGGNAQFDEPVYINEKDMELCSEHTSEKMRRSNAVRASHSMNFETHEEFNGLPENFDIESYVKKGTGTLIPVKEGDIFELGGALMEIIETPGHTKGGISVLWKEKNVAFIGDAAGAFVWLFSEETSSRLEYISALKKMQSLHADEYIGGHNPIPMHDKDFNNWIKVAKEADYEKGQPFKSFFEEDYHERVCTLNGMTMEDMFKPGFAAIVISPDK